jgi:hypothetical protein
MLTGSGCSGRGYESRRIRETEEAGPSEDIFPDRRLRAIEGSRADESGAVFRRAAAKIRRFRAAPVDLLTGPDHISGPERRRISPHMSPEFPHTCRRFWKFWPKILQRHAATVICGMRIELDPTTKSRVVRLDHAIGAVVLLTKRIIYDEMPTAIGGYGLTLLHALRKDVHAAFSVWTYLPQSGRAGFYMRSAIDSLALAADTSAMNDARDRLVVQARLVAGGVGDSQFLLRNNGRKSANERRTELVWSRTK